MKYILLAYTNADDWQAAAAQMATTGELPPEVLKACEFYEGLHKELTETGEFVTTEGLSEPVHARTVRKGDGGPVVTDGPFAESKEVLVSFAILDCASYDRALQIAARVVDATGDAVEVRPIGEGPGPMEQ
ncbi:YciI family protein [Prauserella flavalba]|uniref:YCII-related domain-containing protein n=1 Tax=Prauserella flavalba TaxID=1477506 RepID=A0A318M034_9PSEU|nr:YciI family protein [Prauserella flavalba]PXY38049.1 hypothetical protein BA062_05485 [Prauserella flavalba]